MPFYNPGGGQTTPFGRNEFLRSTHLLLTESYTFDASTMPTVTIDGFVQKVLQPGTLIAKISAGKVGVFQAGAADGRQTAANILGVNLTFLPYELMDGDQEISVVYGGSVDSAKLIEYDASGVPIVAQAASITAAQALPALTALVFHV